MRPFMRGLLVACVVACAPLPATEPGALARDISEPSVGAGVYCLWRSAQYGASLEESAAWLVAIPTGRSLLAWPIGLGTHRTRWRGHRPEGAVALLHTHPHSDSPRPSPRDLDTARSLGLPVATVTREGIFAALPDGRVVRELASGWFAAYRGTPARECRSAAFASSPGAAAVTESAAFARADGPDSSH
jgi:hypothetical protein